MPMTLTAQQLRWTFPRTLAVLTPHKTTVIQKELQQRQMLPAQMMLAGKGHTPAITFPMGAALLDQESELRGHGESSGSR